MTARYRILGPLTGEGKPPSKWQGTPAPQSVDASDQVAWAPRPTGPTKPHEPGTFSPCSMLSPRQRPRSAPHAPRAQIESVLTGSVPLRRRDVLGRTAGLRNGLVSVSASARCWFPFPFPFRGNSPPHDERGFDLGSTAALFFHRHVSRLTVPPRPFPNFACRPFPAPRSEHHTAPPALFLFRKSAALSIVHGPSLIALVLGVGVFDPVWNCRWRGGSGRVYWRLE